MLAVDLDELAQVGRIAPWLSVNRGNLFSLREKDYLPVGEAAFNADPSTRPIAGQSLKDRVIDRKSTRLNSSHTDISRMPSSA